MNMNEWARAIHENAVQHGFWAEKPSVERTFALILTEMGEAMSAMQHGEEMVYLREGKPEGVAVEVADAAIRALDRLGWMLRCDTSCDLYDYISGEAAGASFAEITCVVCAGKREPYALEKLFLRLAAFLSEEKRLHSYDICVPLMRALVEILCWFYANGLDFERVMAQKHEYNRGRPYKHGKLF